MSAVRPLGGGDLRATVVHFSCHHPLRFGSAKNYLKAKLHKNFLFWNYFLSSHFCIFDMDNVN